MKKLFSISILCLIVFVITACGDENESGSNESGDSGQGGDAEFTLKIGGSQPAENLDSQTMYKFKEVLEEKSDGRIEVEVYPANQIGNMTEMNEAVQSGTQDLSYTSIAYIAGNYVEKLNALAMPYLITEDNLDKVWELLDEGEIGQELQESLNEVGYVNIGFGPLGYRNTTNDTRQIKSPEDYEGIKIRLQPNDAHIKTFETLGASPVGMNFAEVYSALQQGVIDAQENPLSIINDNNFAEVQQYLTIDRHFFDLYGMWMSKKVLDELPEDLQEIVKESGMEAVQFHRDEYFKNEAEMLEKLSDEIEIYEPTPEEIAQFQEATKPVYDWYLEETEDKEFAEKLWQELGLD